MRFFTGIDELSGRGLRQGIPCYCERIIYPNDLLLQSELTWQGPGPYTMTIELFTVDGAYIADVTANFSYYFFKNPVTGRHMFNIRLESFADEMCAYACWILKVKVTAGSHTYFEKITDRYCQTSCCDIPRGVGFFQPLVIWPDDGGGGGTIDLTGATAPKVDECGNTYITLSTKFDCYDRQTGDYYANPGEDNIINGNFTNFTFERKTNLKGSIEEIQREITRVYSRNCRLTKSESARQYSLDVHEIFPPWKMLEITDMLHAPYIFVDGRRYEYEGGEPFSQVEISYSCDYLYRANNIVFRDCYVSQIFGCGDNCADNGDGGSSMAMVIQQGAKLFYDEDRQLIGDSDDLLDWFRNQPGITKLEVLDPGDYACSFEVGFVVTGTGYIPTSVYVDGTAIGNRIYGMSEAALADLCAKIEVPCGPPTVGQIIVEADVCAAPTLGIITIVDMTTTTIAFMPLNDWTDEGGTVVTRAENTVKMILDLSNSNYPNDPILGSGVVWQWGQLAVSGNTITDDLLKNDISPIIYVNEQPIDWAAQGVTHDEMAGTLDFSAIGGAYGTLSFQYVPILSGGIAWQWGQLAVSGNTITDDLLKNDIAPIIYVNEQPIDWVAQGVTHDAVTGTLDFSAIGGAYGTLSFQYVSEDGSPAPGFGMLIGMVDVWARPSVDVYANGVTVNTLGYVYYSGSPTSSDSSGSYIDTTIIYNL